MKKKHFVLGFIFNNKKDQVLLVHKKRPTWQKGRWNGIGGHVEKDETPLEAMDREAREETSFGYPFKHVITFVCPGGTVFVFKTVIGFDNIPFQQVENEELMEWSVGDLPATIMSNLKWIIPVCLSNIRFPLMVQQDTLGVE